MMGGVSLHFFFKFANKLAEYFFNKYSANLLCQYLKKTEVFFKFANKLAEYFFNKYSANLLCQYLKKSGRENICDGGPLPTGGLVVGKKWGEKKGGPCFACTKKGGGVRTILKSNHANL